MVNKKNRDSFRFKPFESGNKEGRHLRITLNMMDSPAWKKLSSYAIHVYLLMKIKFTGTNESDISLTYKEGMEHMTQRRFTEALDELIDYGFIIIVKHRQNTRECNVYGLSDQWQYYGTDRFKIDARPKKQPDSTKVLGKKKDTS